MDALTRDEGIATDSFSASCALRMRVSISAIGSLMLMLCLLSPAGFGHAGNLAAHGDLAQLVAPQTELAVYAARAARQLAAIAHARGAGVARQPLQLHARRHPLVLGLLEVVDDGEQRGTLDLELLHGLAALFVTVDDCGFCHGAILQVLNGNLKAASSAFASSSVFAVVVMLMFMPRRASILSYSTSGKIICSFTPRLYLPRPSKARCDSPRKSRIRGIAMLTRRSRNSYMRPPRSVTMQPIGRSLRILNPAMGFFDNVTTGFCPAILVMSPTALSMIFLSLTASPTPMLSVIFSMRGTCIVVLYPNFFTLSGTTVSL